MASSSKELKARLKAAKAAVGKKDFQEVYKLCQEVFSLDESNYTAHVFAGLAELELGHPQQAGQHYRTAVGLQPGEQLAWKGLADFYDKHAPSSPGEQEEAVEAYQKLLTFVESDLPKLRSTLQKLTAVHRRLGSCSQAVACYSRLLATYHHGDAPPTDTEPLGELWMEVTEYLLEQEQAVLAGDTWEMLERGLSAVVASPAVSDAVKRDARAKYIQKTFDKFTHHSTRDSQLEEKLRGECHTLIGQVPAHQSALAVLAHLALIDILTELPKLESHSFRLEESQWPSLLRSLAPEGGEGADSSSSGLGYLGEAVVCGGEGRWKDAGEMVIKGVSLSPELTEGWLLASLTHLHLCDFPTAQEQATQGLKIVKNAPAFARKEFENQLKLCLAQAYLGLKGRDCVDKALTLLSEVTSHESHVTTHLVRAHLLLGNVSKAEELVKGLAARCGGGSHAVLGLEGELSLAQKDYQRALELFTSAVESQPTCADCHFARGRILWEMPEGDRVQAYSTFLQAARLQPFNPDIFLHIGHYQKLVTKDLRRAVKCYQKATELQPSHMEAAVALGDTLFALGDEEEAFKVYKRVASAVPQANAKQAWVRMGLYQRKSGLYTEAIKSFQNALAANLSDRHCWECLGEAYLARGSHNSALRAFTKAVELDPRSLYCLYQIASIKQLLGQLKEAVSEYTAVLEIEPSYVPALKGRGENHLLLTRLALQENFDGRAVDHVSLALRDLTSAARLRPQFTCLWKLIGDCCVSLCDVGPQVARPSVPKVLRGHSTSLPEECEVIEKKELLLIGCRAYGRALQLSPDSAFLWHDLAASYYHLGKSGGGPGATGRAQEDLHTALNAAKKAVSLQPQDLTHWNMLGVIAACSEVGNSSLAQHAFIKSIQVEPNNVVAWANLGALYLKHGNIKLAHQAFRNAQSLEPGFVQAWIGQALVAESIGHSDSMDLFRHGTELAYHPEGSTGYGYWVCHTLGSIDPALILNPGGVSLNPMAQTGALQARDCLQKYVERCRDDACAYNLLGLLYEQEGLYQQAEAMFSSAAGLLNTGSDHVAANLAGVQTNHTRILSALGRHSEALPCSLSLCQLGGDPHNQLQLALALFRSHKFTESIQAYEQALAMVTEDKHRSAILTAVAMAAIAMGDHNKCKTTLFKAFQTPPPSLHGLVSLCVFGCLCPELELTLIQAALLEIAKALEGRNDAAVLLHPSCAQALKTMEFFLQQNKQATECVETLQSVLEQLPDLNQPTVPPPISLTLSFIKGASSSDALRFTQRLVHAYPCDVWSQAILTRLLDSSLRTKYQQVVVDNVEVELSGLSSREPLPRWRQSLQKELLELQNWAVGEK